MKFRHTEKGMALVITLMMLAIVTFMAVIFLAMSRRERNSVKIVEEQNIARMMSDHGSARASADIVATMNRDSDAFLFGKRSNGSTWTANDVQMIIRNGLLQRAKLHYGLRPSRSYTRQGGFVRADGTNANNVSYEIDNGGGSFSTLAYGSADYLQSIANMQYDARVPVWENPGTSNAKLNYYLDLNRNGVFDENGYHDFDFYTNDVRISNLRFSGDPEWIGVLERPDQPHSEVNRFIGRYAYLVLPMGKSLDINFIHNQAAGPADRIKVDNSAPENRYSRNWGVGSWELNLAGFLVDFHKDVWRPNTFFYNYEISPSPGRASGIAFADASGILAYRLRDSRANLYTPRDVFPQIQTQPTLWTLDLVDMDSAGPYAQYQDWYAGAIKPSVLLQDTDLPARAWFGADQPARTAEYSDIQRPFTIGSSPGGEFAGFYNRFLKATSSNTRTNYDRYGYYRWIAQMGADSVPAIQGKIHLNYTNEPGTISTNLKSWFETNAIVAGTPTYIERPGGSSLTNFFLITADAMLKRSLITNVFLDRFNRWRTNYTVGGSYFTDANYNTRPDLNPQIANWPVRHDISITNIQIYHEPVLSPTLAHSYVTNGEYSSALHRLLQVAANLYDNMTNAGPAEPYFPSVFRPIFTVTDTNIYISGYNYAPRASNLSFNQSDWITEQQLFNRGPGIYTNINLYGQAAVVGAKKGWPNFNELDVETFIQVGRKLRVTKTTTDPKQFVATNQMFGIGMSNRFGLEAWNSYSKALDRPIVIKARIITDIMMDATLNNASFRTVLMRTQHVAEVNNFVVDKWDGRKEALGQLQTTSLNISTNQNGESDFRVPIYMGFTPLPFGTFDPTLPGYFRELIRPKPLERFVDTLEMPDIRVHITNRFCYIAYDQRYDRIVDYVSVENLKASLDIRQLMIGNVNAASDAFSSRGFRAAMSWDTNLVTKTALTGPTVGITNQLAVSQGIIPVSQQDWRDYNSQSDDIFLSTNKFEEFMRPFAEIRTPAIKEKTMDQAPFAPARKLYLKMFYQVNDPLVHYMAGDMQDPHLPHPGNTRKNTNRVEFLNPPNTQKKNDDLGVANSLYRPWGAIGDFMLADYRIYNSDDWTFPIAKLDDPNPANVYGPGGFHYRFRNIGDIGRVHRGTPWQTIYLKAGFANTTNYADWAGSWGTHPTTDWKLVDLFTTAMSENATRGLLSVNQTNMAAWSAVLSGVQVITNSVPDSEYRKTPFTTPRFGVPGTGADLLIQPGSAQLSNIVAGINRYRASRNLGVFGYMGEILGTPELSMGYWNNGLTASPYLNYLIYDKGKAVSVNTNQLGRAFTDEALEAIPQRILSLLKADEPRMVVYAFGQTLKPAPRSLATSGNFYNLVQNYQVTGEYATKTIIRVEGELRNPENPLRTVVESYEQLPPFD